MYSFESTNDFGHKTGYVSRATNCSDWNSNGYFYPLEQLYEFDNLFVRFASEINNVINNGGTFDSGNLYIGKLYDSINHTVSSKYIAVRLHVNSTRLRVYYGYTSSRTETLSNYKDCDISDYLAGNHQYNLGRIYLIDWHSPSTSGGLSPTYWYFNLWLGDCRGYIGEYQEPSSSYPNGRMVYTFSTYTLPSLITAGTENQTGYPASTANIQNQPELVGRIESPYNIGQQSYICSNSGEYNPDPTPPGPGPGPTPSSDPNDRDPEPSDKEDEGGGQHNPSSDPLPIPGLPSVGAVSGGAFNTFRLTETEFNTFNGELYSDNAWTALKNYFNDPLDFMIGCIMVPAVANTLGQLHPKFNSYVWSQAYWRVINQYVELDCGSIVCRAYYGSCFDYSPYTKVQLFLPFIGYVELDPDEIMDMAITVKYHIDVCTGDCVAFVSSALVSETARVIGQYNGNCGVQIPITRSNYDNVIASGMNLLAASAGAVGMYRAGAASIGAASLAGASDEAIAGREIGLNATLSSRLGAATMSAVAGAKSSVSRNGTLGGTCGLMGMLKPHLLVHTPRQSKPSNYMEMRGYPANIGGNVGDFTGYLEVCDVRLNNIPATIDEINEIYELLKGGIII